jgi:8-oxo-dGTP pyrophosphatase MutT (NUDIX family)
MHKYREFKHVYFYEYEGDIKAKLQDGEVESIEWVSFDKLKELRENSETTRQTPEYYSQLFDCLDRF